MPFNQRSRFSVGFWSTIAGCLISAFFVSLIVTVVSSLWIGWSWSLLWDAFWYAVAGCFLLATLGLGFVFEAVGEAPGFIRDLIRYGPDEQASD